MEKILIIGGNAAGLTAASRAKRINPRLDVTVLEKLPQIAYSTCGLPYFLSGMVGADALISYTPERFQMERGISVHTQMRVDAIVPSRKRVEASRVDTGERLEFSFDRLLIATGVKPKVPSIPGVQLANVFTLNNLPDAIRIREALMAANSVSILGAGYVGLELAESLHALGKAVTVFERENHVMSGIDADMAEIIEYELRRYGTSLFVNAGVLALTGQDGRVNGVKAASGLGITPADVVLLDTGVDPNVDLARDAGIQIGLHGGISVDSHMETNVPGVYAAGNCAESWCSIRRRPVLNPIGTVAAKQGRIAGENMAAQRTKFSGAIGTAVVRVFDLNVARTGLSSQEAASERIPFVCARIEMSDRASYYPTAQKLWVKLIVDSDSRRLVGAQAVGYGDACKRIDVAATAIAGSMRIDDFAQLDLAYAPPYSSLWDSLLVAAHAIMKKLA